MPDVNEEVLQCVDKADPTMTHTLPVICPVCQKPGTIRASYGAVVYFQSLVACDPGNRYMMTCDHHSLSDLFNQLHKRG